MFSQTLKIKNAKSCLILQKVKNANFGLKMLKSLTSQNITSVIIMHDLNLALKYGDMFIGITKDKKIVQCGVKEFFSRENLKRIFDIDFKILEDGNNIYVQNID